MVAPLFRAPACVRVRALLRDSPAGVCERPDLGAVYERGRPDPRPPSHFLRLVPPPSESPGLIRCVSSSVPSLFQVTRSLGTQQPAGRR